MLTKQATEAYANYEQLKGGVETLFDESADLMMKYAADAYKTAGVSSNTYMETSQQPLQKASRRQEEAWMRPSNLQTPP